MPLFHTSKFISLFLLLLQNQLFHQVFLIQQTNITFATGIEIYHGTPSPAGIYIIYYILILYLFIENKHSLKKIKKNKLVKNFN